MLGAVGHELVSRLRAGVVALTVAATLVAAGAVPTARTQGFPKFSPDREVLALAKSGRYDQAFRLAARNEEHARRKFGVTGKEYSVAIDSFISIVLTQINKEQIDTSLRTFDQLAGILKQHNPKAIDYVAFYAHLTYEEKNVFHAAEYVLTKAVQIKEQALGPDDPSLITSLSNLAARKNGPAGEAEIHYRRAISIGDKALGPLATELETPLHNLANMYQSQGRMAEYRALQERLLSIEEMKKNSGNPRAMVDWLIRRADLSRSYAESDALLRQAMVVTEKLPDAIGTRGWIRRRLGHSLLSQKKYDEAYDVLRKSLDDYMHKNKASGNSDDYSRAQVLEEVAKAAVGSEDIEAAAGYLKLAIELKPDWQRLRYQLGDALLMLRRKEEAYLAFKDGVSLENKERQLWSSLEVNWADGQIDAETKSVFSKFLKTGWSVSREEPTRRDAILVDTFGLGQGALHNQTGKVLGQIAARLGAPNNALAGLVRGRQDLLATIRETDEQLVAILKKGDQQQIATIKALNGKLASLRQEAEVLRQRLGSEFPSFAEFASSHTLSIPEVTKLLGPDEVLLLLLAVEGSDDIYAYGVTRVTATWQRLPVATSDLAAKLAMLRRGLDRKACRAAASEAAACKDVEKLPFDLDLAHELYTTLLGPVEDVIKDKKNLIVVPSGPLTSLPFNVLVTDKPKDKQDYANAQWLAERHAITVLPTVSSLKALRTLAKSGRGTEAYLGIGDPVFRRPGSPAEERSATTDLAAARGYSDYFRGRNGDLDMLEKGLSQLPSTGDELKVVARILGANDADIITGRSASEATIKKLNTDGRLSRPRVMHFATHALVAGQVESLAEPAIVLSLPKAPSEADDGLLTASEVAGLKLNADWVVLSACNTAAGDKPGAEALSGLAKAFFYAGARALLVSHWPVQDTAGAVLVARTFKELADNPGIGRAEALHRSQIKLMKTSPHPAIWAPFMVVGDGGALN